MIRVVVVAASPVVQTGFSSMLSNHPNLKVVGSVTDLDILAREVGQLQPDILLINVNGNYDPSIWEQLISSPELQYSFVIIAEDIEDIEMEVFSTESFRGIIPNLSTESEIMATLEAAASGLVVLHPDFVESLLTPRISGMRGKSSQNPLIDLTSREIEVLRMLGSGLSNKEIAKRLHISEHTVKFHVGSIFQKLEVSTRAQAVAVGIRQGLILL